MLEALPSLRLISQTGRVTAHIDLKSCTERDVMVCAGGKGRPHSTAELTWALILAALRHVPEEVSGLRQGRWQSTVGVDIFGKTLRRVCPRRYRSVVANIGQALARGSFAGDAARRWRGRGLRVTKSLRAAKSFSPSRIF